MSGSFYIPATLPLCVNIGAMRMMRKIRSLFTATKLEEFADYEVFSAETKRCGNLRLVSHGPYSPREKVLTWHAKRPA